MPTVPAVTYKTDCWYYEEKAVNYSTEGNHHYSTYFPSGSPDVMPICLIGTNNGMFWRPVAEPCDGCPWYTTENPNL